MTRELVVLGAGGHAKVCIELLQATGYIVVACVGSHGDPDSCLGIRVLKGDHHLPLLRSSGLQSAFVAIGENRVRQRLCELVLQQGFELVTAVSPVATVSNSAKIGAGVAIMAGVVVNATTVIERFSIINTGASIDHDCHIRQAAHIAPRCAIAGNVSVGEQSFLGIGTCVIPKINIGSFTTVGAGSVVIRDIPSNTLAFGNPAACRRRLEGK